MRRPVGFLGVHERDPVFEVELVDDVGRALMQVHRAVVHLTVRGPGVNGAEEPARRRLDDRDRCAAGAAQVDVRPALAEPSTTRLGGGAGLPTERQTVDRRSGRRAEEGQVGLGQRQLGGSAAQVRSQHVRVRRVQHGRLDRPAEERFGMVHEVGVQRIVASDEDAQARRGRPDRLGPACCHIEARVPG